MAPITPSNEGPLVNILTWVSTAAVVLAVGVKLALSSLASRVFHIEDVAILLALVFSIGHAIALSFSIANGVGQAANSLSSDKLDALQKGLYSADIVFVCVVEISQTSVLLFLAQITPVRSHRQLIKACGLGKALLSLPLFFAIIFQCSRSRYWDLFAEQCVNRIALWATYAAFNIIAEIGLIALPTHIMREVRVTTQQRALVLSIFAARILVIAAFIAQIVEAFERFDVNDRALESWSYRLTTQLLQCISIITVCTPYIRKLLLGLESGMMQTGHIRLVNEPSPNAVKSAKSKSSAAKSLALTNFSQHATDARRAMGDV